MTTPVARLVSTRMREAPLPLRLSYVVPAYRYEEPQEGRMREFTTAGLELIGPESLDADAESLFTAIEALDALGLGDAHFDINHVAIVDGVLAGLELDAWQLAESKILISGRNIVALRSCLAGSGPPEAVDAIVRLALTRGREDVLESARSLCRTDAGLLGIERLRALLERAATLGYGERLNVDCSLLRDIEYYTGFIFEGFADEVGFGLCGGGRYDTLLPRFGFESGAVGWSLSVERMLIALERRHSTHVGDRRARERLRRDRGARACRRQNRPHRFRPARRSRTHRGSAAATHPAARHRDERQRARGRSDVVARKNGGLTIAVPKGALYEDSAAALRACGIDMPEDPGRRLTVTTSDGSQVLLLRPTDVPAYVEFGAADCGIVGADVLWETTGSVCELADLGFGACRLVVAARRVDRYHEGAQLPTFLRVATKFERSAEAFFAERDVPVQLIKLHGSVELSPLVGLADLIVDLVATGNTLREHDLVVVNEIALSTARFVVNPIRFRAKYAAITALLAKLERPVPAC